MTDINDKKCHHNLHRSFSDGIRRWQNVNKEFQFYTGKENVNIFGGHRFHTGKKFKKINGRISSDGKEQLESTTDTHAKDFRIEDLYSKPTKDGYRRQTRKRLYIKIIVYDLKKRAISNQHRTKLKTN